MLFSLRPVLVSYKLLFMLLNENKSNGRIISENQLIPLALTMRVVDTFSAYTWLWNILTKDQESTLTPRWLVLHKAQGLILGIPHLTASNFLPAAQTVLLEARERSEVQKQVTD